MQTNPNDGINHIESSPSFVSNKGLSKREYFAAIAMQGVLTNPPAQITTNDIPKLAVKMADALIKALNTPTES